MALDNTIINLTGWGLLGLSIAGIILSSFDIKYENRNNNNAPNKKGTDRGYKQDNKLNVHDYQI